MVPDDFDGFDDLDDEIGSKATLDPDRVASPDDYGGSDDRSVQKVELDLDDAPFLDEEDEDDLFQDIESEELVAQPDSEDKPEKKKKKERRRFPKRVLVILAALLLFILGGGSVYFLIDFIEPKEKTEILEPTAGEEELLPEAEPEEKTLMDQEVLIELEPFWVEKMDDGGDIRFVQARFSMSAKNPVMAREINQKQIILRDAIYYYLRNKPLAFLSNKENADTLKKDVLTVVNQYLGTEQVDDLWIEEYVVK
jgi:flagellar FliL protein